MKKNVLIFGLIAGAVVASVMVYSAAMCSASGDYEGSMLLGYASMILAFSMVFVGIKNYRDKYLGGVISFGKAFKTGLLITLVASTVYVVVWLIDFYVFVPDFMEKYTDHMLQQAREGGASAAMMQEKTAEMDRYREMYKNPFFVVLMTYMEILPVGLVITVISALLLKRKNPPATAVPA